MGPDIKRFHITGAVKEEEHLRQKQMTEESRLKKRMFRKSYVPVLDIVPIVETTRIPEKETFRYNITIYGVRVDEPDKYEGWLSGEWIRSTPTTQLERLFSPSDLML